jgi:hypothetical protein
VYLRYLALRRLSLYGRTLKNTNFRSRLFCALIFPTCLLAGFAMGFSFSSRFVSISQRVLDFDFVIDNIKPRLGFLLTINLSILVNGKSWGCFFPKREKKVVMP